MLKYEVVTTYKRIIDSNLKFDRYDSLRFFTENALSLEVKLGNYQISSMLLERYLITSFGHQRPLTIVVNKNRLGIIC